MQTNTDFTQSQQVLIRLGQIPDARGRRCITVYQGHGIAVCSRSRSI